jgi:hypothetical protein
VARRRTRSRLRCLDAGDPRQGGEVPRPCARLRWVHARARSHQCAGRAPRAGCRGGQAVRSRGGRVGELAAAGGRRPPGARRHHPRPVVPRRPPGSSPPWPGWRGTMASTTGCSGQEASSPGAPALSPKEPASVTAPPATATRFSPCSRERATSYGSSAPGRLRCTTPYRPPAHARPTAGAASRSGPETLGRRSTWPTVWPGAARCPCPSPPGWRAGRESGARPSPRR